MHHVRRSTLLERKRGLAVRCVRAAAQWVVLFRPRGYMFYVSNVRNSESEFCFTDYFLSYFPSFLSYAVFPPYSLKPPYSPIIFLIPCRTYRNI